MLKGSKFKGRGYQHPLWDVATKISSDEIDKLFKIYKNNPNSKNRAEFILGNLYNTLWLVQKYVKILGDKNSDDLVSAALWGLCQAVDRVLDIEHDNYRGYITLYLHRYISDYLTKSNKDGFAPLEYEIPVTEGNLKETYQDILAILENDVEHDIVNYRIDGFTDEQIGKMLELSTSTIWLIRKSIEKRYKKCR